MFSRKLNYKSLPNIRDLGGMRTDDGRQIKSGKLIRSGHQRKNWRSFPVWLVL